MGRMGKVLVGLCVGITAGCVVGPDYELNYNSAVSG